MQRVGILLTEHCWAMHVCLVQDFFHIINSLLKQESEPPFYQTEYIALHRGQVSSATGLKFEATQSIAECTSFDVLVIPGIEGQYLTEDSSDIQHIFTWLNDQVIHKTTVIALSTAAYFFAQNMQCNDQLLTTHWAFLNRLQRQFPQAKLTAQHDYLSDERIMTASSLKGCFYALLHWVAQHHSENFAQYCASYLLVHLEQYIPPLLPQHHHHHDLAVKQVQQKLERDYAQTITLAELAGSFGINERTLTRRFHQATQLSINEYLQQVRLKKAKVLLLQTQLSIQQISIQIGYENTNFFIRLLKKAYGTTPAAWRKAQ